MSGVIPALKVLLCVTLGLFGLFGLGVFVMNWVLVVENARLHSRKHSLVPIIVPSCVLLAAQVATVPLGWLSTRGALLIVAAACVLDPGTAELLIWLATGCRRRERQQQAEARPEEVPADQQPAYSDGLVELSAAGLRLRHYYFPFGSKLVKLPDIVRFEKLAPSLTTGQWRIWGTGDFTIYFPRDWRRPRRTCIFRLILASQQMRIGFTVEDPERFTAAMQARGVRIEDPRAANPATYR